MDLIRQDPDLGEEYNEAAAYWDGLGNAMMTMLQLSLTDSSGSMYRPIALEQPGLMLYFGGFILIVTIALMNLITAIIVDTAVSQSTSDREAQKVYETARKKSLLPKLRKMFEELDADGSGMLELEELVEAPESVKEQLGELANMDDCEALFKLLDYDNSGSVSCDDFVEGIIKVSTDKPVELMCMMKQLTEIMKNFSDIESMSTSIEAEQKTLRSRIDRIEASNRVAAALDAPSTSECSVAPALLLGM